MSSRVTLAIVNQLGLHLKTTVPKLRQVLNEFPEPTEKLVYPALSIVAGIPEFRPFTRYPYNDLSQSPEENIEEKVKWAVGWYDFKMQLDLWCGNKWERHDLYEEFFNGFNSQTPNMGLSLKLSDYHDVWARFDQQNYQIEDSDDQAQRKEWRVRVEVLAQCVAIQERTEKLIKQGEVKLNMYQSSETNEFETTDVPFDIEEEIE